jgi:hypothetical protein
MRDRHHLPASVISAEDAPAFWRVGILWNTSRSSQRPRALNFYTPGGFDESISMLASPAAAKTLPPHDSGEDDPRGFQTEPAKEDAYRQRIAELHSQSMP